MKYAEQILFCACAGVIIYFAGTNEYDNQRNYKKGLIGMIAFVCSIGMLRPYNGPFTQQQWIHRAIFWLTVIYNAILVFLAFQNETEARQLIKLGDDRLGRPVTKDFHTYDDNCEFEWKNIWDNLDHYYLTHCVNWFMVALLARDAWILHIWSLWDEVLELSWQHILPHFRECWWDHILLDVLLSNTIFIIIGLWVSKKLGIEQYDWLGRKGKKSFSEWEFWTNHHHFGNVMGMYLIITINFLDGFFIMNSLWMIPKCWMTIYRLIIWFFIGNNGWRETFNFLQGKAVTGQMRYISFWTIFMETFISIKFLKDSGNIVYATTPPYILYPWVFGIFFSVFYYLFLRWRRPDVKPYPMQLQMNGKTKVQ